MSSYTPWISDLGDGNYKNPVIFADYSDPDVIRVGSKYYMTASSFNCTPGLPVLTSTDLVNWELIGHGIKNVPHTRYDECQPGCGVWAPAIRFFNNTFYIVFPMPDEGLYVIESKNPENGWSEPYLLVEGKGLIDPCPFWDEDGKAYMIHGYAFSRAGIKSKLNLFEVSPDLKTVKNDSKIVVDAMTRLPTLEGPKMFKKDGLYYISAPIGGVPQGSQMIFRSKSPWGPYEEKIVISQRGSSTNGPHQGSLLDDIQGNWWFIHFQDYQPWGRIVHLQPAKWSDGWPIIGIDEDINGVGKPVLEYKKPISSLEKIIQPKSSDSFDSGILSLQWQWNANHKDDWYEIADNKLHLIPGVLNKDFHLYERILCQKINAPLFRATTTIDFTPQKDSEEAGICMVGLESARIGIRLIDKELFVVYTVNNQIMFKELVDSPSQTLFIEMDCGGFSRFGIKRDNETFYLGQRFRTIEGRWIGARFGLYNFYEEESGQIAKFSHVRINS